MRLTNAAREAVVRTLRWPALRWVRDDASDRERGDVPGWVLVTLMTAGLVLLLWGLAGPALSKVFNESIAQVSDGISHT